MPAPKYECTQCGLTGKRAVCASCAQTCHQDHNGLKFIGERKFTCDCATHSKCINNNPVGGGGGGGGTAVLAAPPGARVVTVQQPMFVQQPQYVMQQRLVQQNGVTFLQTVAVPVQVAQPVMMQQPMMMMQQSSVPPQMAYAPNSSVQMGVSAAPAVQMSYPPTGVQMAQPVQMSVAPGGVQMSHAPPVQMSQPVQMAQQPDQKLGAQLAHKTHNVHLAQAATQQAAVPDQKSRAPAAASPIHRSRSAQESVTPIPMLQHRPSAPAMTMVDAEFDALKARPTPTMTNTDNNYGSLTLAQLEGEKQTAAKAVATQSHYGVAPPLAGTTATYDRVSDSVYTKAPIPTTVSLDSEPPAYASVPPLQELDDDVALPDAPSHEPASKSKVKITQSRVYA